MMNANSDRVRYLWQQYFSAQATEAEYRELVPALGTEASALLLDQELQLLDENPALVTPLLAEARARQVLHSILLQEQAPVKRMFPWTRWVAAASIIGVLFFSYFLFFKKGKERGLVKTGVAADIAAPVKSRARITLANGSTVYLDSVGHGTLAQQGNVRLVKLPDGRIAYETGQGKMAAAFNVLENPRGSAVIAILLADGTRVWLNAGSSITYPVVFMDEERKVSVTGEAYFEVSPHPASPGGGGKGKMPFVVQKGDMQVRVLGTHFNVNAYDDESEIKVTLLEGSVQVNNHAVLQPGQQAAIVNGKIRVTDPADPEGSIAWKNGLFAFSETDIQTVMRQIARWYDVDVVFEGTVAQHFNGTIERQVNVSKVLGMLEKTGGVRFSIEGKKVVVKKY